LIEDFDTPVLFRGQPSLRTSGMKDMGGCLRSFYRQKIQIEDEMTFIMNFRIFFEEAQRVNA
jgi:hypothetical protein